TDAEIRPSLADDSDGLGSIDFDMPGSESETFDDEKVADDLTADFDLEFGEGERFTNEFTDDLVAERATPKGEETFDFADLELADSTQSSDDSLTGEIGDVDFDLDDDLENAQSLVDEPPVLSSSGRSSEADLDDLGFDDLENLELDDGQEDSLSSTDSKADSSRKLEEN